MRKRQQGLGEESAGFGLVRCCFWNKRCLRLRLYVMRRLQIRCVGFNVGYDQSGRRCCRYCPRQDIQTDLERFPLHFSVHFWSSVDLPGVSMTLSPTFVIKRHKKRAYIKKNPAGLPRQNRLLVSNTKCNLSGSSDSET